MEILRPLMASFARAAPDQKRDSRDRRFPEGFTEEFAADFASAEAALRKCEGKAGTGALVPLTAWLSEKFAALALPPPLPLADDAGERFYQNLDLLLTATGNEPSTPAQRHLTEVYAACLTLGYEGALKGRAHERTRRDYLARCRAILARPVEREPRRSLRTLRRFFVFALPAILYLLYRIFLYRLYGDVLV